ncbi:MAG TPA: hypothetical protein VNZ53_49985 [Steroidobacteraceae bacterium]|nr:hypothetical protein [Steroidobacteraceae bacterium]
MKAIRPTNTSLSERWAVPYVVALAVAFSGVLAMPIVDHGPWSRPLVQTAEVANYKTTGDASRAAGATVTPTAPSRHIEPAASGAKPVQPATLL